MTDEQLRKLIRVVTGATYDFAPCKHACDCSFSMRCHPRDVEQAAFCLREYRVPIEEVLFDSVRRYEEKYIAKAPPLCIWHVILPDFVCLERERSLVIPRPWRVPAAILAQTIFFFLGDRVALSKRHSHD